MVCDHIRFTIYAEIEQEVNKEKSYFFPDKKKRQNCLLNR